MPKPKRAALMIIGSPTFAPLSAKAHKRMPPATKGEPRTRRNERYQAFMWYSCRVVTICSETFIVHVLTWVGCYRKKPDQPSVRSSGVPTGFGIGALLAYTEVSRR